MKEKNYDVENLKHWIDRDGNTVYGNPKKYNKSLEYLMSYKPEDVVSKKGIRIREIFHPVFVKLLPVTSVNKLKIVKNHDALGNRIKVPKDKKIIFVPNHGFKDDVALSIMTAKYHSYVVFASLPDFYYTTDGYALWANGVFTMDRRDQESKESLLPKLDYAFENGLKRVIIFPEGVWCKDPNQLVLHLWKGAYLAAKKNDALLMPISLLNKDMHIDGDVAKHKKGICYSTLGEPIDPKDTSWEELEQTLRGAMAKDRYMLMESYSQASRSDIKDPDSYWDNYVSELIHTAHTLKKCRVVSPDGEEKIEDRLLYDYEVENNHRTYDVKTKKFKETGGEFVPTRYMSYIPEQQEKELIDYADVNIEFDSKVYKKKKNYFE